VGCDARGAVWRGRGRDGCCLIRALLCGGTVMTNSL
jgi:hypothetical protein